MEDLEKFITENLNNLKRNEINLSYKINNDVEITAESKIGGKPYLPKNFIWPYYQKLPLSFLAQINLVEVSPFDKDKLLSDKGMLYFFYELETQEWGFKPQNKGCAKVFYFEDTTNFTLIDFPEDMEDYCKVPEFKVDFKSNISLPEFENFYYLIGNKEILFNTKISNRKTYDIYSNLYDELSKKDISFDKYTKLLGYPNLIQGPMEEECATVTRGINMNGIDSPKKYKEEIKKSSKDWILLFQMDTVETDDYELMFGDCGHIYFWIKKQDLANKNFENIWLILQCS